MKTFYIVEKILYKVKAENEEQAWEKYYENENINMSKKLYRYKPKI